MIADQEILELMDQLPTSRRENIDRFLHTFENGHIVIIDENGIKGFAELYRMKEVPEYPVIPWPVNDLKGEILYCFAAVCKKGYIKKLIHRAKEKFNLPIYYHREKHGHRLERI